MVPLLTRGAAWSPTQPSSFAIQPGGDTAGADDEPSGWSAGHPEIVPPGLVVPKEVDGVDARGSRGGDERRYRCRGT